MANAVPFVIHAQITPERGSGKRFEIQRSREKIASGVYSDLVANFSTGNIATPGGGGDYGAAPSLSNLVGITAVKPQFGENPDTITIVGFYNGTVLAPYPQVSLVAATPGATTQSYVTGPASGAPGWRQDLNPTSACDTQAKALKEAIESAVTSETITIIRLEIGGVVYGRGGYHFPS